MDTNGMPEVWPELTEFLAGTPFQLLVDKLSGLGFAGELLTVVILMVLTALIVGVIVLTVRGCICLVKKLLAY